MTLAKFKKLLEKYEDSCEIMFECGEDYAEVNLSTIKEITNINTNSLINELVISFTYSL